jgi:S-DNA-T family DNA segregation ATPase FtsK/SpoIIIE
MATKRVVAEEGRSLLQELLAIGILGMGLLLLLALFSHDPGDTSFWQTPTNNPLSNFIGPVGAYLAAVGILLFGAGAYLFPILMIIGGSTLLFARPVRYAIKIGWFSLILISGAALLQLMQPMIGPFGGSDYSGGLVGFFVYDKLLAHYLGRAGAGLSLSFIYLAGLVLLFEVRPIELVKNLWAWLEERYRELQQSRLDRADPMERLELEQKRLEKEKRRIERRMGKEKSTGKKNESSEFDVEAGDEDDEWGRAAVLRPEPKVIDTTRTRSGEATAEPGDVPEEEKPKRSAPLKPAVTKKEREAQEQEAARIDTAPPPSDYSDYVLPSVDLLQVGDSGGRTSVDEASLKKNQDLLIDTLEQFGIEVEAGDITRGATITRYEVYPAPGVRVERIAKMHKNIARAMRAESVNILAPIPGKDTVGVEVGNSQKAMVHLRDLFESEQWKQTKAKLPIALGKDVYGKVMVADLADMPHLLIGGSTGSGKSVCINCVLMSFLYRFNPDELRIIMVDPKVVELQIYNDLPHLVVPVVTEVKKVMVALKWVINEMEKRYRILAKAGVRNITAYNAKMAEQRSAQSPESLDLENELKRGEGEEGDDLPGMGSSSEEEMPEKLAYIVVIIDELADLMQQSPADVELAIARLSAKARAAGIHLIIATQTPRAQVITGVIKTNVPCRVAFQVPSALDSRVILDENGAENLMGKGDLLYLPPGSARVVRAQGAFVSDDEVGAVVEKVKSQTKPDFEVEIHDKLNRDDQEEVDEMTDADRELFRKALEVVVQEGKASTSMIQRRLRIGYNTAARLVDQLEGLGVIGPADGAKAREILIDPAEFDIDQFVDSL